MMRHNNLQFPKGAVVFAEFSPNGELCSLNDRPLLVVSNPLHFMNNVIVCELTSRNVPGIRCSLWNYKEDRFIGKVEECTIVPTSLHSINTVNITSTCGVMDPFIMKKVDEALDFFLGRTMDCPEYLTEFSTKYYGAEFLNAAVTPGPGEPRYTSENELLSRKFTANYSGTIVHNSDEMAEKGAILNGGVYPEKNTPDPIVSDIEHKMVEAVTKELAKPKKPKKIIGNKFPNSGERLAKQIQNWRNRSSKSVDYDQRYIEKNLTNYEFVRKLCDNESMCLIASRAVKFSDIMSRYKLSYYYATQLRDTITQIVLQLGGLSLWEVEKGKDASKMSTIQKVGMVLYTHVCPVTLDTKIQLRLNPTLTAIKNQFHIDFYNEGKWKVKPTIKELGDIQISLEWAKDPSEK